MRGISRLMDVSSADPDDQRRSRLLNILLLGIAVLALLALLAMVIADVAGVDVQEWDYLLYRTSLGMLVGVVLVFVINRYWSGGVARSLFLLLIVAALAVTDEPQRVVEGRTLFMFTIPILMASVLLRSYASFVVAGLIGLLLAVIAWTSNLGSSLAASLPFTILALLTVALVSWLSARSLERTLADLRIINRELDQRVDHRTRDLAQALAREETELSKNQAILDAIADGVIVFDADGLALLANPSIGRILERPFEEVVGSDIESLMGEDVDRADQEMLVNLLREQETSCSAFKFGWSNRTLSVSFAPVRSTDGKGLGTVVVFRDFTREAEIDRMKNDLVSIVSHELRTPLTSIKGYLDLVLMGASGFVNKQQESFLQIAKRNADRLHELVSQLLDISRIESGRLDLDVQVVSVPEVVNQVASSLRKEFSDRNLILTLDMPANLPEVFADPTRLAQILTNLLSNAYKYTAVGGATIRAQVIGNALQIDVLDTGVGISAADQEKIFTRYFRAEDTIVRQQPGSGLGLNITKSLVEVHGGEIWVESEPRKGTTFSFTLPLPAGLVEPVPVEEMEPAMMAPEFVVTEKMPALPIPAGPWVLIADDEVDVAYLFKRQLEKEGYRVTVVNQGSRVAEVARQLQPELITLDLLMEVDGLSVLRDLKADPATADIPVVVVSVIPEPDKGLSMGAADYLIKPLNEGELLTSVRNVLDQLDGSARNKILVVDDEIDIVGWLKHSLIHYGFQVSEAYDGIQALEAVTADTPDLILLDLRMPRMDGRTTIRRLREQDETRQIPIIVLSAHSLGDESERVRMLGMGVKGFLKKPITVEHLVAEVRRTLQPDGGQAAI
jgi:PAS domain S-box-containing protein